MTSNKIAQLQLLQQNLQNIMAQKQQFQSQLVEVESALSELKKTDKAYKIVGKLMLAASRSELEKELVEKKEVLEVRLKNFTQQEERIQKNFEEQQQEVVKELQGKKEKKK